MHVKCASLAWLWRMYCEINFAHLVLSASSRNCIISRSFAHHAEKHSQNKDAFYLSWAPLTKAPTRPWFPWCPRANTYTGRVAYFYSRGGTGQGEMAKITPIKINLPFPSTNNSTITSPDWSRRLHKHTSWRSPKHTWVQPPTAQKFALNKYTINQ